MHHHHGRRGLTRLDALGQCEPDRQVETVTRLDALEINAGHAARVDVLHDRHETLPAFVRGAVDIERAGIAVGVGQHCSHHAGRAAMAAFDVVDMARQLAVDLVLEVAHGRVEPDRGLGVSVEVHPDHTLPRRAVNQPTIEVEAGDSHEGFLGRRVALEIKTRQDLRTARAARDADEQLPLVIHADDLEGHLQRAGFGEQAPIGLTRTLPVVGANAPMSRVDGAWMAGTVEPPALRALGDFADIHVDAGACARVQPHRHHEVKVVVLEKQLAHDHAVRANAGLALRHGDQFMVPFEHVVVGRAGAHERRVGADQRPDPVAVVLDREQPRRVGASVGSGSLQIANREHEPFVIDPIELDHVRIAHACGIDLVVVGQIDDDDADALGGCDGRQGHARS